MLQLIQALAYRIWFCSSGLRRFLWIPLLAAGGQLLLFGYVYPAHPEHIFSPDSITYIQTAQALIQTGHFAKSPAQPDIPQLGRTPGYPLFLASFFWFYGEQYALIVFAQIFLSACTICLIELIAWKFWRNQTITLLAALLLAIDIPSAVASQQILTETLFTVLFMLLLWTGQKALSPPLSASKLSLFGLLSALTTLIRPITYYLIIPFILLLLLSLQGESVQRSWKTITFSMIMLLLPWGIVIGGWQARNFLVAGTTEFSTTQSINLLFYRGADILARSEDISFDQAQERLGYRNYTAIHPERQDWTVAQLATAWKQEGLSLIRRHPKLALKSQFIGLMKLLFDPGDSVFLHYLTGTKEPTGPGRDLLTLSWAAFWEKWGRRSPRYLALTIITGSYLLFVYAGGLMAGWQRFRKRKERRAQWNGGHLLPVTMLVYMLVISAGPEAYSRFRIPIMPILCLYAGQGWILLLRSRMQVNGA